MLQSTSPGHSGVLTCEKETLEKIREFKTSVCLLLLLCESLKKVTFILERNN